MRHLFPIILIFLTRGILAQGVLPADWGLEAFRIDDPELGKIDYYVSSAGLDQDKPVLFLVTGVRGLPTMLVVQTADQSLQLGVFPPDQIHSFSQDFHVVLLSKAGTPFCDTLQAEAINPIKNLEDYQPSEAYIQNCGMDWEVEASKKVLCQLEKELLNSSKTVVALGISEGGQLVPRLALEYPGISHLVGLMTTTLNQFYSSIINRRMDAAMGQISQEEAQNEIDSLFKVYREIYADPESTEKWYDGHPYRRWGSFCSDIPLEHLVRLEIPILYIKGTADRNSPVLQTDYAALEFLRLGKDNLSYKVYPGMNHWLMVDRESLREEVFKDIKTWILDPEK